MYKHLYDKFSNWYHGGQIYLLADPHFSDEEANYLRKNYIGDEEQVKRINSKVGKNDTIIFLGDIGNIEYIKKIRGYKVLIMGNHDSGASNYKKYFEKPHPSHIFGSILTKTREETNSNLFDEVYEGPLVISEKVILSHEPVDLPYFLDIHGHTHGLPHRYDDKHINCVAEAINYTPVSLKDILESGVLKNVDSIHRLTIDNATERKRKKNSIKG